MLSSAVALAAASFLALVPEATLAPRFAASTNAPLTSAPPASPPTSAPPPSSPPSAPPTASPPLTTTPPVAPGDAPPSAGAPSTDVTTPPSGELPPTDPTQSSSEAAADLAPADFVADSADTWAQPPASVIPPKPKFVPPPVPQPPSPPSGRGLLIGAAVVGGAGLVVRVLTTASVIRAIRHPSGLPMDTMIRGAIFYDPLIAAGLGMAGGGMARRGRLDAHRELFEGMPPKRARRSKLGWGLFGAGLGTWAVTRIAGGTSCRGSDDCKARVWEVGYYVSLAGTIPGAILGGYASGFNGYHRRFGHLADVSLAPIASRQSWGLALSGRF